MAAELQGIDRAGLVRFSERLPPTSWLPMRVLMLLKSWLTPFRN